VGEAEDEELGEEEKEARDGEEEERVAKVGDAVGGVFGRVVGGVVHGRLEDGLAFGKYWEDDGGVGLASGVR